MLKSCSLVRSLHLISFQDRNPDLLLDTGKNVISKRSIHQKIPQVIGIIDVPVTMTLGNITGTITGLVMDGLDTFLVLEVMQTTTGIKGGARQGDLDLDHLLGDVLLTLAPIVLGLLDLSRVILDAAYLQEFQVVTECLEALLMIIALVTELSRARTSIQVNPKF